MQKILNSFNILGVILLIVGVMGLLSGGKMVFDPGRAQNGNEWLVYLIAGGLMLVNGFLPSGSPVPTTKPAPLPKP